MFQHVVEELTGAAHAPAIMVGDSATDVATARAARAPVIVMSYGYTPSPRANWARMWCWTISGMFPRGPGLVESPILTASAAPPMTPIPWGKGA